MDAAGRKLLCRKLPEELSVSLPETKQVAEIDVGRIARHIPRAVVFVGHRSSRHPLVRYFGIRIFGAGPSWGRFCVLGTDAR